MTTSLAFTSTDTAVDTDHRVAFWERIGASLAEAGSYDEALETAGLDWGLTITEPSPGFTIDFGAGPVEATVPDRRFLLRSDTHTVLGVVGSRYTPVTNRDVFAVTELLANAGATWVAGGARDHGRTCFMLMRPPASTLTVRDKHGNTDRINVDVQIRTGHGGTESLSYEIRATRTVTSTSVSVSTSSFPGMDPAILVRHTASAPDRVHDAKQILARAARYVQGFGQIATKLVSTPVGTAQLLKLADQLWPKPSVHGARALNAEAAEAAQKRLARRMKRWEDRRDLLTQKFRDQRFAPLTAYAAFNTVADYLEWGAPARGDRSEAAARRAFDDAARAHRSRALSVLLNPGALFTD